MKIELIDKTWTIATFLRSAAKKFEEIAADCRKPDASPQYASLATTFDNQQKEAISLAELFEKADSVTLEHGE